MKRAPLERPLKTLTALSLQPPHTSPAWTLNHKSFLLLWLLKHFFQYYHYFKSGCLLKSQTIVVAKAVNPLFCVCFIPLLEFHNFSVWDWGFMENCHLCDKLLFSPIKHRKCAIRALHTIMLSHLRPFDSQQGASGWSSVRRWNLFKLGELESFQKEELKGWDYSPDGALERCLTSDGSSEAWYLFPLICNKVFLNKYFHLTFPLREPV